MSEAGIHEEGLWSVLGVPELAEVSPTLGARAPRAHYDSCSSLPCGLGFSHPTSNF